MNSCLSFWTEFALRLTVPVATVLVAAFVAAITWFQWKTNREKLRLDLYQRRFEIYLRVLDFHVALWQQDEPKLDVLHVPFMKASWESKFLFPKESGIYDFLDEYNLRTARVRVYRTPLGAASQGDVSQEERAQLIEDKIWIKDCIGILDEKLGPYLKFH
jgi:hypothetical protein